MKGFPGLQMQEEIDLWHVSVKKMEEQSKSVHSVFPSPLLWRLMINFLWQDWYQQKLGYPWIFPGLNLVLSSMDSNSWNLSINNTVETAHAGQNAATSIKVPILTAISQ